MPRRRMKGRPRVRKDWVYTNQGYLGIVYNQTSGVGGALAQPLVLSANTIRYATFGGPGVVPPAAGYQGGYVLPERRRQVVYAVDGHVMMNPSGWALGNEFIWGWRIAINNMDPLTSSWDNDPNYSMWAVIGGGPDLPHWRNDSDVLAEGRIYRAFGENTSNGSWVSRIRWSSKRGRALKEDEGLFVWLEGASASVATARNRFFCRALVKAPD